MAPPRHPPAPPLAARRAAHGARARWAFAVALSGLALFVVVACWVSTTSPEDGWDVRAQRQLLGNRRPDLLGLARCGGDLGAPWLLAAAGALGALTLWRRFRSHVLAAALVLVPLATAGLVHLLTLAFAGRRPDFGYVLGLPVLGGSFPSARVADATALWGLLALTVAEVTKSRSGWLLCGIGWLVVSGTVAWDQLLLGRWPSDVAAGYLLAVSAVAACCGLLAGGAQVPAGSRADRPDARLDG